MGLTFHTIALPEGGYECYTVNNWGNFHTDTYKPSAVFYNTYGHMVKMAWHDNGNLHRIDKPAVIEFYVEGKVRSKKYYYNNHDITDIVENLFGYIPDELSKDQSILLKLSLPPECFVA